MDDEFPNRWMRRDGPTFWPARSPDITPLDIFLWGYVKTTNFKSEIRYFDDLKTKIEAVALVRLEMLVKTRRRQVQTGEMLDEMKMADIMLRDELIFFFYQMVVASLIIQNLKYVFQKLTIYC